MNPIKKNEKFLSTEAGMNLLLGTIFVTATLYILTVWVWMNSVDSRLKDLQDRIQAIEGKPDA